mgnify:CR=1 FL=1
MIPDWGAFDLLRWVRAGGGLGGGTGSGLGLALGLFCGAASGFFSLTLRFHLGLALRFHLRLTLGLFLGAASGFFCLTLGFHLGLTLRLHLGLALCLFLSTTLGFLGLALCLHLGLAHGFFLGTTLGFFCLALSFHLGLALGFDLSLAHLLFGGGTSGGFFGLLLLHGEGFGLLAGDQVQVHSGNLFDQPEPTGQVLPLGTVLERLAREHPGQVLKVELESERGRWIYEVRLLQSGGRLTAAPRVLALARRSETHSGHA